MKYLIETRQLEWYSVYYSVEASSEEEARQMFLEANPKVQFISDDYIDTKESEIVKIELDEN